MGLMTKGNGRKRQTRIASGRISKQTCTNTKKYLLQPLRQPAPVLQHPNNLPIRIAVVVEDPFWNGLWVYTAEKRSKELTNVILRQPPERRHHMNWLDFFRLESDRPVVHPVCIRAEGAIVGSSPACHGRSISM